MIHIASNAAKKRAAPILEAQDPEFFDFLKTVSGVFGPMAQVDYQGPAENDLMDALVILREEKKAAAAATAKDALQKARSILENT